MTFNRTQNQTQHLPRHVKKKQLYRLFEGMQSGAKLSLKRSVSAVMAYKCASQ